jgi:hypothetical protein
VADWLGSVRWYSSIRHVRRRKMENWINLIVNNGSALALLAYFIYKDNKFTETITKSLTAIEESLDVIKQTLEAKKK